MINVSIIGFHRCIADEDNPISDASQLHLPTRGSETPFPVSDFGREDASSPIRLRKGKVGTID
jgi:hypothetical protein